MSTVSRKAVAALAATLIGATGLTACSKDRDVVDQNLTKDADNFKVARRVVFLNGITDKYLLSIEGYCSIKDENGQLEVLCKTGGGYKKHFLGLSDNVTYFAEQINAQDVSSDHYKVTFKPSTIVPMVEVR